MVWVEVSKGVKTRREVIYGNNTAITHRNLVLRLHVVPLIHQRNLMLQQDKAMP